MKNVYDVIIIGAGASGLAAAIECSRRELSCLIIDKNKKPGNKLYATGNGRCNVTNDYYNSDVYYNNPFADQIMQQVDLREFTFRFMHDIGIHLTEKKGYYYPMSMQASSVVWALLDAIDKYRVDFEQNTVVHSIEEYQITGGKIFYKVSCSGEKEFRSRSVILACGGCSAPELGAIDSQTAYTLFDSLNLHYQPFLPALVPIKTKSILSYLTGVRQHAVITVGVYGPKEEGELQFTDFGLSGIVIFNQSENIRQLIGSKSPYIYINVIPDVTEEDFLESYNCLMQHSPNKSIQAFLNGYMNDKLADFLIGQMEREKELHNKLQLWQLTPQLIRRMHYFLSDYWHLEVTDLYGFDKSQASSGGICTDQIDPATMKVTDRNEVYAVGEALDVLGKCGGYNLSFALYSGHLAGSHVLLR